ncbi:DUF1850 domain-containing protein [Collimonas sp. H4R21]|jgi:hypothetical protein|uniref:DUF1850 domain-containing protein n=1 Tax=Collimonas rhizosphaerae TaxID=3126357 RepID=A0ABU9PVD6_9BURK
MLCLASGSAKAVLAIASFTLAWQHSVEKIRWEESYRVEAGALVLEEARVQGSGAGMEPPLASVLKDGFWRWQPRQAMPELLLTRSEFTPDYQFCTRDRCQSLTGIVPPTAAVTRLWACDKNMQAN